MIELNGQALRTAVDNAASALVNSRVPELPPIFWRYDDTTKTVDGMISDYEHSDQEAVAQQWAVALGLTVAADPNRGTRRFSGVSGDLGVEVWYVADRAEFGKW